MINFVLPTIENGCYNDLIHKDFILPIMRDDIIFSISDRTGPGINVHFFLEPHVLSCVGLDGYNVFMSHGIADKSYRNAVNVEMFDCVIVSGPAWHKKLTNQGLPTEKIFIGGYPKLDALFRQERIPSKVLWAPTHNNSIYTQDILSSYPKLLDYMPRLKEQFDMAISVHPANDVNHKPTRHELLDAAVVIADSGSTIYEAWALGIPVVFPSWLVKKGTLKHHKDSFEVDIFNQKIDYHATSTVSLFKCINAALKHGMTSRAKTFIDGIFSPHLRGHSGIMIHTKLKELDEIYG